MRVPHDFAVYDATGKLAAIVEVKRRFGTDESWARQWHALLSEREGRLADTAVWLITPERFYVWPPSVEPTAAPERTLDAAKFLEPYFSRLQISKTAVDSHVFEGIVGLWLRDMTSRPASNDAQEPESELLGPLRGGEVVEESFR